MKKIIKMSLILLTVLGFSSCTVKQQTPEPVRTITVSGTGTVSVDPDVVSLTFLVKTTEWNVSFAAEKNAANTANVIEALKTAGVSSNDISTYDYRITQDNSNAYAGKYTITNSINVLVRNINDTGKIIDAAVKNNTGANGIIDFEYLVSDKTSALRQARTLAVQNAQDAASLLAGASGCKIGEVMEIKEGYTSSSRNVPMLKASYMAFDSVETPIEAGTVDISSNITITYTLIN